MAQKPFVVPSGVDFYVGDGSAAGSADPLFRVDDANNRIGINTQTPTGTLDVTVASTSDRGLIIRTNTSQATNVFEVLGSNSSGIFTIDQSGSVYFAPWSGTAVNPIKYNAVANNLVFTGSGAGASGINLNVLSDSTLSFESTAGQLFSIADGLSSGTIFSVNDISGMSSIEVDASGLIKLGEFDGYIGLGTSQTFGQYSGKLEVQAPSGYKALILRPASGSTTNIFEIQNISSGTLTVVDASGRMHIGGTGSLNQLEVDPLSATTKGILVKGAASQSANLIEAQNSSSSVIFSVDSSGAIGTSGTFTSSVPSGVQSVLINAPSGRNSVTNPIIGVKSNTNGSSATTVFAMYEETTGGDAGYFTFDFGPSANTTGNSRDTKILLRGENSGSGLTITQGVGGATNTSISTPSTTFINFGAIYASASQRFNTYNFDHIIQFENDTNSIYFSGAYTGQNYITLNSASNATTNGHLFVTPNLSKKGVVIKATGVNTANLFEVDNSAGTALFYISPSGTASGINLTIPSGLGLVSGIPAAPTNVLYASGATLYWSANPVSTGTTTNSLTYNSGVVGTVASFNGLSGVTISMGGSGNLTNLVVGTGITLPNNTPAITTNNNLYAVGGQLYWNGFPVSGGPIGPAGPGGASGNYGSFYDITTQSATSTTGIYPVSIGQVSEARNVSIQSGNQILFSYPGVYNVQYSIQLFNASSQSQLANIWLRKNGTDLTDTNSLYTIHAQKSGTSGALVAAVNYVLTLASGDYLQFYWNTDSTSVAIATVASGASYPRSPGVIATAQQVLFTQNAGTLTFGSGLSGSTSGSYNGSGNVTMNLGGTGTLTQLTVTSGIVLSSGIPTSTTNALYNSGTTLFWNGASVSGTAGSNTQIIYNNNGSQGASSSLTWDGTTLNANLLKVTQSAGNEGGQIDLALAATNTSLSGTVAIDIYQNKLRFFETTGSNRGAYIDLTAAAASVGTNLLSGGGGGTTTNSLTFASGITFTSSTFNGSAAVTIGLPTTLVYTTGTYANPSWISSISASTLSGTVGIANGGTALSTAPSNGQLLIGNGTNYTLATLTAGSGMGISNGAGSITINSSGITANALTFGSGLSSSTVSTFNGGTAVTANLGGTGTLSQLTINSAITSSKPLVVKAVASQSANLLEVQNSSSTPLHVVDSAGKVGIITQTPTGTLDITTASSSTKGAIIRGVASQSANYLEIQDPSGNILVSVDSLGRMSQGLNGLPNYGNIAIGPSAFSQLTTANFTSNAYNIAIGGNALANQTGGSNNTAIGFGAGQSITNGVGNTLIGAIAGQSITTTSYNTLIGDRVAPNSTTTGSTAFGCLAINQLTTGSDNTAVGFQAGNNITTGTSNVMVGGYTMLASTTGIMSYNVSLGTYALYRNNFNYNTAIGHYAIGFVSGLTAGYNTAVGAFVGYNLTTGAGNTFVGAYSDVASGSGSISGSIVIGSGAQTNQNYQLVVGSSSTKVGKSDGTGEQSVTGTTPSGVTKLLEARINGTSYQIPLLPSTSTDLQLFNAITTSGGITLNSGIPSVTTSKLYASGTSLYWSGQPVSTGTSGGGSGTTTNALTFGSGLAGSTATTFNGSSAVTVNFGGTGTLNQLTINSAATAAKTFVVKSAASQSANVLEVQNSSGSGVFSIDQSGTVSFAPWAGTSTAPIKYNAPNNRLLFTGSGASTSGIGLNVLPDSTLSFEATNGQLFSISDSMQSGRIFGVTDLSGMPFIEVDASGLVKFGEYDGFIGLGTSQTFGQYSGKMEINAPSGYRALILRSPSGAISTQNIFEIQNFSSGNLWYVNNDGTLFGSGTRIDITIGNTARSALNITPATGQTANLINFANPAGQTVSAITPSGSFSGAITPTILTSTGNLTLTDVHNGYIIEQTGVVATGVFTLGTITISGWNCMLVNIGSGIRVASGTNTMRSPGGASGTRTQYSSISIYRRGSNDFVLAGDLA